jgi:hypothetical protein
MATLRSKNLEIRYSQPAFVALEKLQNDPYFANKDIITITGFMKTEEEVTAHYESMLSCLK